MIEPVIPESFRDRPYARQHYARIAAWAARHHPFYMERVHGPRPDFPVITRADVQDHNDMLLNGHTCTGRTSGSTGMPVEVSWSAQRSGMEKRDNADFVALLGGRLPHARIVALAAHEPSERTIDVTEPLDVQVDFILRRHAADGACALQTYPSNLEMLCRYVVEKGVDMRFMRRLLCMSEVYEPVVDELAAQAFPNAHATSTYSSVEVGFIAGRCPHRPQNYHLRAHKLGVEFLDEEGRPCGEGEPGQVVVTDYWNRHSTLVRYALGDIAAPVACDCPIGTPALTHLLGKVRGVLKHSDGRPVLFTRLSPKLRDCPEIRQFQVVQPALGYFIVKFVPKAGVDLGGLQERVRGWFEADFGPSARVEFESCDRIPRSAGGKFHGAICLA
jgi:phenylacetate-coenzyme A ligase PaaK-like adenylate-forming protein